MLIRETKIKNHLMTKIDHFDAIIIGGSYAGLSAAMSLGRALRKVLIIDSGNPGNKQTPHSHNFLTRDGESPVEITLKARKEVRKYRGIKFVEGRVSAVTKPDEFYNIQTSENNIFSGKKIIFATGVLDIMPDIAGFAECWGKSILHCPYCHGYEFKNETTGVLGNGDAGFDQSKFISNWTKDLVLFTNGAATLNEEQREGLERNKIEIVEKKIEGFEHRNGQIKNVIFEDQTRRPLKALYAAPAIKQQTELPEELGCEFTDHGRIKVDLFQKTNIDGIYAAGDNSSLGRAIAIAVSAGSVAGVMLNKELIEEEFAKGQPVGNLK